jgi:hypothetical protein
LRRFPEPSVPAGFDIRGLAIFGFPIGFSWGELTPIFQMPAALIAVPLAVGMAPLLLHAAVRGDHGAMASAINGAR